MFGEVKRLFSFTPMCRYQTACAHGSRICCGRTQWSHLHVYMNFGRHACFLLVFDLISPLTIRLVFAQCYKCCRHRHAKVCCGGFGGCTHLRCSHQRSGCALCTLCCERVGAQYAVDRVARNDWFLARLPAPRAVRPKTTTRI